LDAEKAERERLEEAALATLAAQWSRIDELKQACDDKLAELQKEATRLRVDTKAQIEAVQAQQAAALSQLHSAGRTAEEIAALVELPKDRVRKALRAAAATIRKPSQAGADADRPPVSPPPASQPSRRGPGPTPVTPSTDTTEAGTGPVAEDRAPRHLARSGGTE
jgi:hypothetical protein